MEGNARIWFTPKQKVELRERWKSGQCVADIARALERRNKSGVYRVSALNGEIVPTAVTWMVADDPRMVAGKAIYEDGARRATFTVAPAFRPYSCGWRAHPWSSPLILHP
jgi:enterochelin esterase-like enzyme